MRRTTKRSLRPSHESTLGPSVVIPAELRERLGLKQGTPAAWSEARVRQDVPLLLSAVNWGEVFYMEWRYHGEAKAREAEGRFEELLVAVISVDRERASRAGARDCARRDSRERVSPPNLSAGSVLISERQEILRALDRSGNLSQQLLQVLVALDEINF
jgi:hypothetical protein